MIVLYRLRSLFVVFACLPLATSTAYAGDVDTAEARTADVAPPADEQIAKSIRALSSSRYRDRTAATRKLITLGKDVIPHVAAAAETTDLEVAGRCITILQHLFQSKDATIKAAAGSALKKLAKSTNRSLASRASEATKPTVVPRRIYSRTGGIVLRGVNGVIIRGQVIRPGFRRQPAPRQRFRTIRVQTKGKTYTIRESLPPGKTVITVAIMETVNGKLKTSVYNAKSEAELKKKNAAAYDIYKKYSSRARARARFGAANPRNGNPQPRAGGVVNPAAAANGRRIWMAMVANTKMIVITDEKGKNINIRVLDRATRKTSRFQAKDLQELKKKYPEAAKLYEKHAIPANLRNNSARNRAAAARNRAAAPNRAAPNRAARNRAAAARNRAAAPFPRPPAANPAPNGQRRWSARDGNQIVLISDENGKNISVRVLDTTTRTLKSYAAADLKELKKKHPDAAKLYEKIAIDANLRRTRRTTRSRPPNRRAANGPQRPDR